MVILTMLFVLVLSWPLLKRQVVPMLDAVYLLTQEYRGMRGRRKGLRLLTLHIEPFVEEIPFIKGVVTKLDRILRLAGRPWKIRGVELLLVEVIGAIGIICVSMLLQNSQGAFAIMGLLLMVWPLTKMRGVALKRQAEASAAIRFLKRRLVTQLKMNIPLADALREIGDYAPGDFGVVFRRLTGQIGQRPMREVMAELRREFEVRELDEFCLAIELSDQKTQSVLIEQLDRQINEETHRMDEFIANQSNSVKPKLYGLVGIAFVFTMVLTGYFGYVAISDAWKSGNFFLGL